MNNPHYTSAPTNNLAIISLVAAIASWVFLPLLGAIVAVVTGHMARNEIKQSHGVQGGGALAIIGLVLGYLNLIASCIVPLLVFGGLISVGSICSLCAILSETSGSLIMSLLNL